MHAIRIALFIAVMGLAASFNAQAFSSATFEFDFVGDAGDNADGPQYDMTGVGPTDDGSGCDAVVMVMVDAAGTVVDIDPNCSFGTTGSDDGDYGTIASPQFSPITYALFDVNGADVAFLNGLSQSDPAYLNYLVANGRLLDEKSLDLAGLPVRAAYTFIRIARPVPAIDPVGLGILIAAMFAAAAWQRRRAVRR